MNFGKAFILTHSDDLFLAGVCCFFLNVNSFIAVMKIVQFYSAVESRDILK